jgi:hypothetical protein
MQELGPRMKEVMDDLQKQLLSAHSPQKQ